MNINAIPQATFLNAKIKALQERCLRVEHERDEWMGYVVSYAQENERLRAALRGAHSVFSAKRGFESVALGERVHQLLPEPQPEEQTWP